MAASAHEWANLFSVDLKQAGDRVTPKLLYDAMVDNATLNTGDVCFENRLGDETG